MGKSYRIGRLGEEIRRIIGNMLLTEIKDPRLQGKMISVTGVDVTSDGSYATCYVSVLATSNQRDMAEEGTEAHEAEVQSILDGLKSASGLMRKEIGREIKVRHTPELIFKIDRSMTYGRHIEKVIKDLEIKPEPGTKSSLSEIAKALMKAETVMLYPHVNMDGDALGSCVALAEALRALGKTCKVVVSEDVPHNLQFLDRDPSVPTDVFARTGEGKGFFTTGASEDARYPDVAMLIDCGELKRITDREEVFGTGKLTICIDHHGTTNPICMMNYIDSNAAATGQIVFDLLDELEAEDVLSAESLKFVGEALFTAITTDTGDFQYSNTQKESHEIVADLYDWGIDHNWVSRQIYNNIRPERIRLTTRVLSEMELFAEGKAAIAWVTQEMLASSGAKMEETEWIINDLRAIHGVEVAILLKEEEPNVIKCSLRSEEYVDVAKLAQEFSGGGHIRASGYTDYCTLDEARERIKPAVEAALEE